MTINHIFTMLLFCVLGAFSLFAYHRATQAYEYVLSLRRGPFLYEPWVLDDYCKWEYQPKGE